MKYSHMPDALYMPASEFARAMGIPVYVVKEAVRRGRIRLRRPMEKYSETPYIHIRSANTWAAKYRSI